jgi:DNA (cytosine-5)-methyltransferase 1
MSEPVPVISLFSGAGGLDIGVTALGCAIAVCVDNDSDSVQTLLSNREFHSTNILERDITTLSGAEILSAAGLRVGEAGLLLGGPPCQPFSKAAYWTSSGEDARGRRKRAQATSNNERDREMLDRIGRLRQGAPRSPSEDPRASLVDEYVRVLRETRPAGLVFENVMSITHPTNRALFQRLIAGCEAAGYAVTTYKANAAEFGVPQLRKRIFVLGLRGSIAPPEPAPTHMLPTSRDSSLSLLPPATAGEAIGCLSGPEYLEPEEIVTGRWAEHLAEIPPGQNYKALTSWAGHPSPSFVAETRFWHFLLKLHPGKPSWTIAASPGPWTGPFHWESRRLRAVEIAALQTFPDGYRFVGSRRSIQRQVGNAVPPLLAQRVVAPLMSCLTGVAEAELAAAAVR